MREMHGFFKEKERRYWEEIIVRKSDKPKDLWNNLSTMLGRGASSPVPVFLSGCFSTVFGEKDQEGEGRDQDGFDARVHENRMQVTFFRAVSNRRTGEID